MSDISGQELLHRLRTPGLRLGKCLGRVQRLCQRWKGCHSGLLCLRWRGRCLLSVSRIVSCSSPIEGKICWPTWDRDNLAPQEPEFPPPASQGGNSIFTLCVRSSEFVLQYRDFGFLLPELQASSFEWSPNRK